MVLCSYIYLNLVTVNIVVYLEIPSRIFLQLTSQQINCIHSAAICSYRQLLYLFLIYPQESSENKFQFSSVQFSSEALMNIVNNTWLLLWMHWGRSPANCFLCPKKLPAKPNQIDLYKDVLMVSLMGQPVDWIQTIFISVG